MRGPVVGLATLVVVIFRLELLDLDWSAGGHYRDATTLGRPMAAPPLLPSVTRTCDDGAEVKAEPALQYTKLGYSSAGSYSQTTAEGGALARGIHDARYKRLIEALAAARRKAGMSQTELAEHLGQRQQFVSKYESGERRLDFVEVLDIAKALAIPIDSLVHDLSEPR